MSSAAIHARHVCVIKYVLDAHLQDTHVPPPGVGVPSQASNQNAEGVPEGEEVSSPTPSPVPFWAFAGSELMLMFPCPPMFSSDDGSFSFVGLHVVPSTESSACSIPPDSRLNPGFSSIKLELLFIHLLSVDPWFQFLHMVTVG